MYTKLSKLKRELGLTGLSRIFLQVKLTLVVVTSEKGTG